MTQIVKNPPALHSAGDPGFEPWIGKIPWRMEWLLTPVFLLENPMERGTWEAIVLGVAKSQT